MLVEMASLAHQFSPQHNDHKIMLIRLKESKKPADILVFMGFI